MWKNGYSDAERNAIQPLGFGSLGVCVACHFVAVGGIWVDLETVVDTGWNTTLMLERWGSGSPSPATTSFTTRSCPPCSPLAQRICGEQLGIFQIGEWRTISPWEHTTSMNIHGVKAEIQEVLHKMFTNMFNKRFNMFNNFHTKTIQNVNQHNPSYSTKDIPEEETYKFCMRTRIEDSHWDPRKSKRTQLLALGKNLKHWNHIDFLRLYRKSLKTNHMFYTAKRDQFWEWNSERPGHIGELDHSKANYSSSFTKLMWLMIISQNIT